MTTGPVPPIDHHDVGVGVLDQGVDEPHPECPSADDEVVGLHLRSTTHAANCTPWDQRMGGPCVRRNGATIDLCFSSACGRGKRRLGPPLDSYI